MVTKEIILIIFIPIMLYFIFSSLKMISTLKSENKIGKTNRIHNIKHPFLVDKYIVRKLAEKNIPRHLAYKEKNGFPTYGLRNVSVHPNFFTNGIIATLFQFDDKQVQHMCTHFSSYHIALLAAVEIWAKLFIAKQSIDEVDSLVQTNFKMH